MKRALLLFGLTSVAVAACAAVGVRKVRWALMPPAPADHAPHDVLIEPGSSVSSIARQLQREGLIRDARVFRLTARRLKLDQRLQAGGYRFTRADGTAAILKKLAAGEVHVTKLTIPEGLTLGEVAERVARADLGSAVAFGALAAGKRPLAERPKWVPPGSLEGYLYPETYQVPLGLSEAELLRLMLDRFAQVVVTGLAEELRAQPLSLHETVVLASIIEREARLREEQPLMAAAFLNRLRMGKRLESCATVQYALPERKPRLTYADLKVDSPYNTYTHDGLPPGPISSPGLSALRAVLNPAKSDVLYFVARTDGSHVFSRTLAEHNAAKAAIRRAGRSQ